MSKKLIGKAKAKSRKNRRNTVQRKKVNLSTPNNLMSTIKFEDIKTPTTVEEFRENLKKYVCDYGDGNIYVQEHNGGVSEYMNKTNQYSSCNGYWEDTDSRFTIYDVDTRNAMAKILNLKWTKLDNQAVRELYIKMFGEFSGYIHEQLKEVA